MLSVDRASQSDAFGKVSPYSPQTQEKIDRYYELLVKRTNMSETERAEFEQLSLFVEAARPIGGPPEIRFAAIQD